MGGVRGRPDGRRPDRPHRPPREARPVPRRVLPRPPCPHAGGLAAQKACALPMLRLFNFRCSFCSNPLDETHEPVRVDLSRPDEAVCLVSACPHVLLHLDYRYPFVAILVALGRDAFGCVYHGSSNLPVRHRASTPHGTVSLFVCTTIEPPDVDW